MYACPECGSPRKAERVWFRGKERLLILKYGAGCEMKIKAEGGHWSVQNITCLGIPRTPKV